MTKKEITRQLLEALDDIGRGVEPIWDMEIVRKHFEPARKRIRRVIVALAKRNKQG
jgi:hypothetical protein